MTFETLFLEVLIKVIGLVADKAGEQAKTWLNLDDRRRQEALLKAWQAALASLPQGGVRDLVMHQPFIEEVVIALLDPVNGFDLQKAAAEWSDKLPAHKLALTRFFKALEAAIAGDDLLGPVLLRYQELRAAGEVQGLPSTEREVVRQVIGNFNIQIGNIDSSKVDIQQNNYYGDPPKDAARIEAIYLEHLAGRCEHLTLRGMLAEDCDTNANILPFSLRNVYIALNTTQTKEKTADQAERQRPGKKDNENSPMAVSWGETQRDAKLSALEAVIDHRWMVLLGGPGSGKTTFVHFLTQSIAKRLWQDLPDWPQDEWQVWPVLVTLRNFARWLNEREKNEANPDLLYQFLETEFERQKLEDVLPFLRDRFESGKALVLLDGLDETPSKVRKLVLRAIEEFSARYKKCRYLVTCRVFSYHKPAWRLAEDKFPVFNLDGFDKGQINQFIEGWYAEVALKWKREKSKVEILAQNLRREIQRDYLAEMSPNPLMLTIMAIVNTLDGTLPETKVLLYERTVEILLWKWEQQKSRDEADVEQTELMVLLSQVGRTRRDLRNKLEELAFEAHQANKKNQASPDLAGITAYQLQKKFCLLHPDGSLDWAVLLIECIRSRSGLLLDQGEDVFVFPHRSFQEYLAGAFLARQDNFAELATNLLQEGDYWREVILYAVGYLTHISGNHEKPRILIHELNAAGELIPSNWLVRMSGRAILEFGMNRLGDTPAGQKLARETRQMLSDLAFGRKAEALERCDAGDILGEIGDPRFDPDLYYLPREGLLGFVHIPAGEFIMGSDKGKDSQAYDEELPQHTVLLPEYYLARYPVTVAQYRAFVKDSGYQTRDEDSLRGSANHPVVLVTWYDALEYTKWLTDALKKNAKTPGEVRRLLDAGWRVTLPSEAEWEKGARGADGRIYPWGDKFDAERANTSETGLGRTSSVGCFPGADLPYGLLDMSGNVWEWTRSIFKPYPYQPKDGREELKGDDPRVLRGGAFSFYDWVARCAYRYRFDPDLIYIYFGFRVVLLPG